MNAPKIRFDLNPNLYLKDPVSSDLGLRIIGSSINMIDEMGYEAFTFRKLAKEISSTEASIYRYFENKHKVLLYISSWYWNWMELRLHYRLANIDSPKKRLEITINALTEEITEDQIFSHVNEVKLNRIIICESSKSYLTKDVDVQNETGVYLAYKRLVQNVCDIVIEINPKYKYPHMLISNMIEGAHMQRFFADHLPRLTDQLNGEDAVTSFYQEMIIKTIT